MSFAAGTLIYLVVVRLAIVGAGIVSMVLGYLLFLRLVDNNAKARGSTVESSFVGVKLSVKNAAPGTAFALFGAILIIVMLVQSSPSITQESLRKIQSNGSENTISEKIQMRGNGETSISSLTTLGRELDARGDKAGAERAYRDAVTMMAEPMNDLAWLYLEAGKGKEATGLAIIAVQLRPDEPRYADTLTKARIRVGIK